MANCWKDSVLHWKRKLEKGVPDEKILEILHKLKKVPITVELLQETGIGKVVNSLKRYDSNIASRAVQLVAQWKEAVVVCNEKTAVKPSKYNKNNNGDHVSYQTENKYLSKSLPSSQKPQKYKYVADAAEERESYYDPSSSKDDYRDYRHSKTEERVTYNPNSTQEDYRKFLESYQENSNTGLNEDSNDNKYTNMYSSNYLSTKNSDYGSGDEGNDSEPSSVKLSRKYEERQDPAEYKSSFPESSLKPSGSGKVKYANHEPSKSVQVKDGVKTKSGSSSSKMDYIEKKSKHSDNHSKKSLKHDSESKESDRTKSSKKSSSKKTLKVETLTDGFNSSVASFEACLGFNDSVVTSVKSKPKNTTTPTKVTPSKSASTNSHKQKVHESSSSEKAKNVKYESSKRELSKNEPSKNEPSKNTSSKKESSKPIHKSSKRKSEKELDPVPEALKRPKLKPLEQVDVLSTLPEIQPEYKPLRLRIPDSPPPKKKASMSNEEAIAYTSSRKEKTAVYAGRRHQFLSEVPSLFDSCVRVLIENIDGLGFTGGVPYDLLKPILEKCTPVQLYTFEDYNHYLMEETNELWEVHSKRDFKCRAPDEDETWRDLYLRLYDEREARLKSVTANISASMRKAVPVRQTKLAYVDSVAKPPRGVARKQARYGTALPVAIPMKAGPPSKATPRPTAPALNALATAAAAASSSHQGSQLRKMVKAPLMQKTLKFMKQRFRR